MWARLAAEAGGEERRGAVRAGARWTKGGGRQQEGGVNLPPAARYTGSLAHRDIMTENGSGGGLDSEPNGGLCCGSEPGDVLRRMPRKAEPPNKVTVVLGAQWGDEGKGKVVDLLAQDADIVCRCQVSEPAGSQLRPAGWRGASGASAWAAGSPAHPSSPRLWPRGRGEAGPVPVPVASSPLRRDQPRMAD